MALPPQILVWSETEDRTNRISDALTDLIRKGGVACAHETTPEGLMAAVLDDRADLLIADLGEVTEREVLTLRNCRRARPQLPLIVITSGFNERFRCEVLPLGVHFYLASDFIGAELDESVRSALKLPAGGKIPSTHIAEFPRGAQGSNQ